MRWLGTLRKEVAQATCTHSYSTNLIFEFGEISHYVMGRCVKCGHRAELFRGTRKQFYDEWLNRREGHE